MPELTEGLRTDHEEKPRRRPRERERRWVTPSFGIARQAGGRTPRAAGAGGDAQARVAKCSDCNRIAAAECVVAGLRGLIAGFASVGQRIGWGAANRAPEPSHDPQPVPPRRLAASTTCRARPIGFWPRAGRDARAGATPDPRTQHLPVARSLYARPHA